MMAVAAQKRHAPTEHDRNERRQKKSLPGRFAMIQGQKAGNQHAQTIAESQPAQYGQGKSIIHDL